MSKPDQRKGEKKSPATKDGNLTAQHLPIGAVVETKSGKTGVITHVHKKAGYLFIHNAEAGKTYHVSMASVTNVNGKSAADILGVTNKGVSTDWHDYHSGDTVVSHDGTEWEVVQEVGPFVYAQEKGKPGGTKLIKWNEIAKHTPKEEGPGSRGSTKWYYDKHGEVQYGEPPEGTKAGVGEPGGHGLKVGDTVKIGDAIRTE